MTFDKGDAPAIPSLPGRPSHSSQAPAHPSAGALSEGCGPAAHGRLLRLCYRAFTRTCSGEGHDGIPKLDDLNAHIELVRSSAPADQEHHRGPHGVPAAAGLCAAVALRRAGCRSAFGTITISRRRDPRAGGSRYLCMLLCIRQGSTAASCSCEGRSSRQTAPCCVRRAVANDEWQPQQAAARDCLDAPGPSRRHPAGITSCRFSITPGSRSPRPCR